VRKLLATAAVAAVAFSLAGCVSKSDEGSEETSTDASGPQCSYESTGDGDFSDKLPEAGAAATSLTLTTTAGEIEVALDEDEAPCTVRSMAYLAREGFFDDTTCHRLTTNEQLKVLQCGDPNGDGTGGPGYSIPDELPTALPTDASGAITYERGVVAMANAGPETGGSQFFLVYGDSTLLPDYTIFGTIDDAGLAVLDEVAAAGLTPVMSAQDGTPKKTVKVEEAQVS
jgi:peptidyl-prolyl cis-trans isomerase B (cyclophilin B)